MIFNCDNFEQVLKLEEQIYQATQINLNELKQEDRQFFTKLQTDIIQKKKEEYSGFVPKQIQNQHSKVQADVLQQSQKYQSDIKMNEIQIEETGLSILDSKERSNSNDTQSLSIISEQNNQFRLIEQQQWQQILNQYGQFFQAFENDPIIKTDKFLNHFYNQNKYVQQNLSNKVYLGLLKSTKEWIVVKEQEIQNESLIDAAQQFVIHYQIYQLYPTIFLKQLLPIYIKMDYERFNFISMSEQGLTDLYQYSQQKLIKDLELQLIFQQILQQIQLLHKHKIAHRDIKPQNIIYVENKGWVLCDFENSLKYNQIYGVYDIKGTFAFLMPEIQINSRIKGIQMKQNLLKNDLYALAITMIVVKYQIKSQEEVQQYLNQSKNQIIKIQIKVDSIEDLQKCAFKYEMRFIRPQQQDEQQDKQIQNYKNQEIIEFLILVGKLNQQQLITNKCQIKYLNQIDEILKQYNYLIYYHIVCYSEIPEYVDQLKNLVKYKELRQRKYWKNMFQRFFLLNDQEQIYNSLIFMRSIGLRDLFLHYAQQYININYDFSIHIMIIDLLKKIYRYEENQYQFNLLLKHRDFQQMNKFEQELFQEYTIHGCQGYMTQEAFNEFIQIGMKYSCTDTFGFLLNHHYDQDDRFYEQSILYIEKIMREVEPQFKTRYLFLQEFIDNVMLVRTLQISLNLLQILKQKLRFQCSTIDWQELLRIIIVFNELLNFYNNKKLIKIMNYVIIFNSESNLQQDTLKFIKLEMQIYCNSKKKSFKLKIINKIYRQIRNLSKFSWKFYQQQNMTEILFIALDYFEQKLQFYLFFLLVYVSKQQELLQTLSQYNKEVFLTLTIQCYTQTKNQKRVQKLQSEDKLLNISNYRNFIKYNQLEKMSYQFHFNQYLCR